MAWRSSSLQTGPGNQEPVAPGGHNADSARPGSSPASAGSGQAEEQDDRHRCRCGRPVRTKFSSCCDDDRDYQTIPREAELGE